jgi:carbon-monoxide dehydrogenase large subunit
MTRYIGKPVPRKEDARMIQGLATYVDDIELPDLHHVAILRSPHAHARITAIDKAAALAHPGVIDVVTGEDTKHIGTVPVATVLPPEKHAPKTPVLAEGKARFVGEPLVAVVAATKEAARDALELVAVDYDVLPAAASPAAALAPGAPILHEGLDTNLAFEWKLEGGELSWKEASERAERVLEQRMENQRLAPIAMEPRGVIARFDPGTQETTLWTSTQIPHFVRTFVAIQLGIPETRLRVIAPDVGGGFGSKLNVYREEGLLCYLAQRTRKPVKWIERRTENFQATIHGRGQVGNVKVAFTSEGKILGIHYDVLADLGAYHQLLTTAMPAITGLMLSGSYAIPHITIQVKGVFTSRMSTDAYRGAGRPEATFVVERVADLVAAELEMDPVELRRRNFPRAFPYKTATGLSYDSGDYVKALDKALEVSDYEGLRREQEAAREKGRLFGIGLSSYVEICALGPSGGMPTGGFGWESATVKVHPTGSVTVMTGASPHGQGQETSFAQIAADMLGLDLDAIQVKHGDTATMQYGIGTFGSRATAVGGTALYQALEQIIAKAKRLAAHLMGTKVESVRFENGRFSADGKALTFGEVAFAAHGAAKLPPGDTPGLEATSFFEPSNFTFPFGSHVCAVEVDAETGEVEILRYFAVDDCGKVINPLLVDGQVHGGIAQGLGQALLERVVYDDEGQLLSGTLMDYALPKAHQLPRFKTDRTETPSPVNPLGVKGVGEAGTIGSTPALVNAVVDALRPLGVTHVDMPLSPERVWNAIEEAKKARGGAS